MKQETIFFVNYQSRSSFHDRIQYFSENKTLQEFMNWEFETRKKVEAEIKGPICLVRFSIERNKIK